MTIELFNSTNLPNQTQYTNIVDFLYKHLDQYGDEKQEISLCLDYALEKTKSFGGFALVLVEDDIIKAATIINRTGMGGYIPENILVYIATHKDFRGTGLGSKLMNAILEHTDGDIALHVEANNPAKKLYEKYGFTNPYLEMRLKRDK